MKNENDQEKKYKEKLTEKEYKILREGGTEEPFTGEYYRTNEKGTYLCKACGNELFSSNTKFKSGSGWPSFYRPLEEIRIELREDKSKGMNRIEVICASCKSHLGHVFDDGPEPTGKRYCINSAALDLKKE